MIKIVSLLLCLGVCLGTPNLVDLFVDSWSFGQTGFEESCNVSVLNGQLFSDWQEVFETVPFGPVGDFGGIMYAEINADAPGNLVVGVAGPSKTFYGFVHTATSSQLGAAVTGQVEDVTVDVGQASRLRIAGSGNGDPTNATLRRLSPLRIEGGGASMPMALNPPQGGVYGASSPTEGACRATCVAGSPRWEVRVVVSNTSLAVWAWAEGYQQFFHVYEGVDLRLEPLVLHVFNMNGGSSSVPLYPRLSGMDVRVKQEKSFSRTASRIYTAPNMRSLLGSALFPALPDARYAVAAASEGVCPALNFEPSGVVPSGYTPLVVWDLAELGVSLDTDESYTISLNAFVNNLTSVNQSVLVSLYDGDRALGAVTQPPQDGRWAQVVSAATPLSGDASMTFPLGAPFLDAVHNPAAPVLEAATPYSSRRIAVRIQRWRVSGEPAVSLFASDPQAPLAQVGPAAQQLRLRAERSPDFPLTPSVAVSPSDATNVFALTSGALRVVVWTQRTSSVEEASSLGVSQVGMVVDDALVGCDGLDHGGAFGPPPVLDACGVCGGDNSTCTPCDPPTLVRDACGVCGGDNSTCCVDYNGVPNECWNWLLLQNVVQENILYLKRLRSTLMQQCPLAVQGTQGTQFCCSPSAWNDTAIEPRACANNLWGPQCLTPLTQLVKTYSDTLATAVGQ